MERLGRYWLVPALSFCAEPLFFFPGRSEYQNFDALYSLIFSLYFEEVRNREDSRVGSFRMEILRGTELQIDSNRKVNF